MLRTKGNIFYKYFNNQIIAGHVGQGTQQTMRTLYTENTMGVDGYVAAREKVKTQFIQTADKFRNKMHEFLQESSTNMIFTEDLKNMIHLAENTPTDMELIVKMLKKFNTQNKELRFGNFVFGPVVMRMFYTMKDDENAWKAFNDPDLAGFFDQLITYQILLDLLYEKKRYKEVMEAFNAIKSRQVQGGKYPKHVVCLVFAACYKENTPESFKYSSDLWKELNNVGHIPMRKAATFAAGLALKQNAPHIALEIASSVKQQNYMTVRNIKVVALAELNRPEDTLPILRAVLEVDNSSPQQNKHTFSKEVIEKIHAALLKITNKDIQQDYNRIEKFLYDHGHVTDNKLDDLLCTEITSTSHNALRKERSVLAASFSRNDNYRPTAQRRVRNTGRPGLQDLY